MQRRGVMRGSALPWRINRGIAITIWSPERIIRGGAEVELRVWGYDLVALTLA